MDHPWIFYPGIGPGLDHFKNKQVIPLRHPLIDRPAFETRTTFADHRGFHFRGFDGRQAESFKLVHGAAETLPYRTAFGSRARWGAITHSPSLSKRNVWLRS